MYVVGNPGCTSGTSILTVQGVPVNGTLATSVPGATITISNAGSFSFDWSSTPIGLDQVIVKASDGANVYTYSPPAFSGTAKSPHTQGNDPTKPIADISHVTFCGLAANTTTTSSSTTSSSTSSTTSSSTTTSSTTSTTSSSTTSTTQATTTTTEQPTTTTQATTSTTQQVLGTVVEQTTTTTPAPAATADPTVAAPDPTVLGRQFERPRTLARTGLETQDLMLLAGVALVVGGLLVGWADVGERHVRRGAA